MTFYTQEHFSVLCGFIADLMKFETIAHQEDITPQFVGYRYRYIEDIDIEKEGKREYLSMYCRYGSWVGKLATLGLLHL